MGRRQVLGVAVLLACATLSGCGQRDQSFRGEPVPMAVKADPQRRQVTPSWSLVVEPIFHQEEHQQGTILFARDRTIWVNSWQTPRGQNRAKTLAWLKEQASPDRRDLLEKADGDVTRFAYLLREVEDGRPRLAVYAFAVTDTGYLQLAIYFADEGHLDWASQVARSAELHYAAEGPATVRK